MINIKIKDPKSYSDVALIVDRESFLALVDKMRQKWEIHKHIPFSRYTQDWVQKLRVLDIEKYNEREQLRKYYHENYRSLLHDYLNSHPGDISSDPEYDFQEEWQDKIDRVIPSVDFDCDLRDIRLFFRLFDNFDEVIAYSVVCNEIPDEIYHSVYFDNDAEYILKPHKFGKWSDRIGIFITPRSSPKEVLKAFYLAKKKYFKREKETTHTFYNHPAYNTEFSDTITNIMRDRELYWQKKNDHLSWKELYDSVKQKYSISPDGIRKAVIQYERKLHS